MHQIDRFWYQFQAKNHIFQTIKKTLKLVQLLVNYNAIKFIYQNCNLINVKKVFHENTM